MKLRIALNTDISEFLEEPPSNPIQILYVNRSRGSGTPESHPLLIENKTERIDRENYFPAKTSGQISIKRRQKNYTELKEGWQEDKGMRVTGENFSLVKRQDKQIPLKNIMPPLRKEDKKVPIPHFKRFSQRN